MKYRCIYRFRERIPRIERQPISPRRLRRWVSFYTQMSMFYRF